MQSGALYLGPIYPYFFFFFLLNFSYCMDLLIYGLFNNTLVSQIVYYGCYTLVWVYELRYSKYDGPSRNYSTSHAK